MVAVEESGETVTVPGLILSTKMDAKRFIKSIIRRESEAKKNEDLESLYKNVDQHLEQLKDYRVKIDFK
jgi:Na+/phosphate symporter